MNRRQKKKQYRRTMMKTPLFQSIYRIDRFVRPYYTKKERIPILCRMYKVFHFYKEEITIDKYIILYRAIHQPRVKYQVFGYQSYISPEKSNEDKLLLEVYPCNSITVSTVSGELKIPES